MHIFPFSFRSSCPCRTQKCSSLHKTWYFSHSPSSSFATAAEKRFFWVLLLRNTKYMGRGAAVLVCGGWRERKKRGGWWENKGKMTPYAHTQAAVANATASHAGTRARHKIQQVCWKLRAVPRKHEYVNLFITESYIVVIFIFCTFNLGIFVPRHVWHEVPPILLSLPRPAPPPSIQWVTLLQPTNPTKAFIRTIVWGGGSLLKIKELGRTFVSYSFPELKASFIWGRRRRKRRTSSIRSQEEGGHCTLSLLHWQRTWEEGERETSMAQPSIPPLFLPENCPPFFVYAGRKDIGNILAIRSRKKTAKPQNARFCSEKWTGFSETFGEKSKPHLSEWEEEEEEEIKISLYSLPSFSAVLWSWGKGG